MRGNKSVRNLILAIEEEEKSFETFIEFQITFDFH